MLQAKLPVVDRSKLQSDKFATGMENEATRDFKLNDSPVDGCVAKKEKRHALLFSFIKGTF